jgi:5-methylcytosine-specific restriction endonuclease McrA
MGTTCEGALSMKRRKLTKEERKQLHSKYDQKCAYCGHKLNYNEMTADHIIPLHKNGTDDIENMNPACRSCNHYKSTYTTEQFREQIKAIPGRLMKSSATFRLAVKYGLITRK